MIAPGWLVAVANDGLLAVGPSDELRVELERAPTDHAALARVLTGDGGAEQFAETSGLSTAAARDLLAALRKAGAVVDSQPTLKLGHSLRSAIVDGPANHGAHEVIWTAEEVLLLPAGVDAGTRAAAIRAFVAGMEPFARLNAYARLISGIGDVAGDQPPAELLDTRLAASPVQPEMIGVFELASNVKAALSVEGFTKLDARGAHRLGPIARIHPAESFAPEGIPELHYTVAEISEAQIDRPTPALDRRVQGSGSLAHSELTARAEGAERFALAIHGAGELRVARYDELAGAIDPGSVFAFNARQLARIGHDPAHRGERIWCAAETLSGERRWVPAELAGAEVPDPLPITSSGVAAHTEAALARTSALSELVERDAFMWTWIQRVSRERVSPEGFPDDVARWADALALQGWSASWVNVTMELQPAILCCLVNREGGLIVGAASRPEATAALRKATIEALVLALRFDPTAQVPNPVEEARSPVDHLQLHLDPERAPSNQFLYSSAETIELGEIADGESLEASLAAIDCAPVFIDLTVPQSRPFQVVRAIAPGLTPLTFGRDGEPLGLPCLANPRRRQDGAPIGSWLDLGAAGPLDPHPFA